MSKANWLLGNFSQSYLNDLIDLAMIGAVPKVGDTTIQGNIDVTGNLSSRGIISGVPLGVYKCATNGALDIKELNTPAEFKGNQNVILVYFTNANTYKGEVKIKLTSGTIYTLYINQVITSETNSTLSAGLHLLSFSANGIVHLDYQIPNNPSSFPTSVVWEGTKIKISGVNMETIVSNEFPIASATTAGIVNLGNQSFVGNKTFLGKVAITDTTESSTTTTGAFTVSGGMGVVGALYVGGDINAQSNVIVKGTDDSSSTTTGALKVSGGVGIVGNCYVGKTISCTNLIVSSTSTFNDTVSGTSSTWSGDLTVSGQSNLNGGISGTTATFSGAVSAVTFTATSSREVKTEIHDLLENATDIIDSVKVVKFRYKNDLDHLKIGFIAEDTHPYLSSETKKKFDIGNSIGLLLKSVQELSKRIGEIEKWISKN